MNKKKNESTVKKKKKRTSETESQLQGAVWGLLELLDIISDTLYFTKCLCVGQ
jgi:hypothetical protein